MPDRADLDIYQGDDYAAVVTVYLKDGSLADIVGWIPRAQIRKGMADGDAVVVAELSCTEQSPKVLLALDHATTTLLNGKYHWDLQLTDPDGAITTVLAGSVMVSAEVTRAATP